MAGGGAVAVGPARRADQYTGTGSVTWTVLLPVFVAASGCAMFGPDENSMSVSASKGLVTAACFYVAALAWSWGPLAFPTPSEIQPLEVRFAGMSIATFMKLLIAFFIGQAFLSMMCGMQFGVYYFFAGFVVLMTMLVFFFVPETSGA